MRAFTRAVSPRIAECQLTHLERVPIAADRASAQHRAYEHALAAAGLEIVRLPELADDPDAVCVEDTALLLDDHAVITRPGAATRIDETASTAEGLSPHFELHRIEDGFLDGGDVMRIGQTLYVGLSSRTDAKGIASLGEIASRLGYQVVQAALRDCLHLKTGATFPGPDAQGAAVLLFDPRSIDLRHIGGVHEDERDDSPEERVDRHVGQLQRRDPEPEDVDHEDRRDASEEVDVDDGEGADREEDWAREAPEHGDREREDEDEDLCDPKDLHVRPERREDVRERLRELLPAEERLLEVVPACGPDDDEHDDGDEDRRRDEGDRDAPAAAARRQAAEDPRAAVLVQGAATSGSGRRSSPASEPRASSASRPGASR